MKGFRKWGKIPLGSHIERVSVIEDQMVKHVLEVRPETIDFHDDTACPLFSMVNEDVLIHADEKYKNATVFYWTLHKKNLKRPRGKK